MDNKLDNDIKNRIREVFDNYEDASEDTGWELLRERFPVKKKNNPIAAWWYAAAAVLLICTSVWFLYPKKITDVTYQAKKNISRLDTLKPAPAVPNDLKVFEKKNALTSTTPKHTIVKKKEGENYEESLANEKPDNKPYDVKTSKPSEVNTNTVESTLTNGQKVVQTKANNIVDFPNISEQKLRLSAKVPALSKPKNNIVDSPNISEHKARLSAGVPALSKTKNVLADTPKLNSPVAINKKPLNTAPAAVVEKKDNAILKMFAADMAKQAAVKNTTKEPKAGKSVLISAYAATYFNYAKGSENQLNVGAGLMSDFKLSKNLRFSTGLALAQNTLNYSNSNLPQALNQQVSNNIRANLTATPSVGYALSSPLAVSTLSVSGYNANLIGLDIPLNLKLLFDPQKSDTYISAGISSGTYVNETYRSTYNYSNSFFTGNTDNQTQQTTLHQHFNTFDFAKTLNLSFGIGYPLGKYNRLIIEPFLKYPLGGLGSQDIRFGASGVNLKFNFHANK